MITAYTIQDIIFENDMLILIVDDKVLKIPIGTISKKLLSASIAERKFFIVSPSGYGIHRPLIDEDLSVEVMLKKF
jgi:hypothetical protein